eukprot:3397050-Rhodomonas_salina.3
MRRHQAFRLILPAALIDVWLIGSTSRSDHVSGAAARSCADSSLAVYHPSPTSPGSFAESLMLVRRRVVSLNFDRQVQTIPLSRTADGVYPVRASQWSGTSGGLHAVQRIGIQQENIYIHRDMDTPSGASQTAYQGTGVPSVRIGHAIPNSYGLQQEMQQRREMEMLRQELEASRAQQARLAASLYDIPPFDPSTFSLPRGR